MDMQELLGIPAIQACGKLNSNHFADVHARIDMAQPCYTKDTKSQNNFETTNIKQGAPNNPSFAALPSNMIRLETNSPCIVQLTCVNEAAEYILVA